MKGMSDHDGSTAVLRAYSSLKQASRDLAKYPTRKFLQFKLLQPATKAARLKTPQINNYNSGTWLFRDWIAIF